MGSEYAVAFDDFIDEYTLNYRVIQKQRKIAREAQIPSLEQYKLQPNSMQLGFIANLEKIRKDGESKALLISATGTGKTYASAFALREEKTKKALFFGAQRTKSQSRQLQVIRKCLEIQGHLDCFLEIRRILMQIICFRQCR